MSRITAIITTTAMMLVIAPWSTAVTIETVPVGNVGNAPDTRYDATGFGAVGYDYRIGKYEVTAGQYCEFLNAVAKTDTYGLYTPDMWSDEIGCKIQREGTPGYYTYSISSDRANRPVNYVSFWDSCRFVNWLHNGQPDGEQNAYTTEEGAYTLNGYVGQDGRSITRNIGATWVMPTEDEWYKAAFYDGATGQYYDYPTGTNTIPSNDLLNPDPGNNANFWQSGYTIGSPYYTTEVGAFQNSASPNGTYDQGGNLWEWNEAVVEEYDTWSERGARGGGFHQDSHEHIHLHASNRSCGPSSNEGDSLGFRVAYVPEPTSMMLLAISSMMLLRRKRAG